MNQISSTCIAYTSITSASIPVKSLLSSAKKRKHTSGVGGVEVCGSCVSVTLPHLKSEGFVSSTTANDAHSWEDDPCEEITEIVDYLLEASVVSHASLEFAPSAAAAAAIGYTLSRVYDVSW